MNEKDQTRAIAALNDSVRALRDAFDRDPDMTAHDFQQVSAARDDLNELIKRIYETVIYRDD